MHFRLEAKTKLREWARLLVETWAFWQPIADQWKELKNSIDPQTLPNFTEDNIQALEKAIETTGIAAIWTADLDMCRNKGFGSLPYYPISVNPVCLVVVYLVGLSGKVGNTTLSLNRCFYWFRS